MKECMLWISFVDFSRGSMVMARRAVLASELLLTAAEKRLVSKVATLPSQKTRALKETTPSSVIVCSRARVLAASLHFKRFRKHSRPLADIAVIALVDASTTLKTRIIYPAVIQPLKPFFVAPLHQLPFPTFFVPIFSKSVGRSNISEVVVVALVLQRVRVTLGVVAKELVLLLVMVALLLLMILVRLCLVRRHCRRLTPSVKGLQVLTQHWAPEVRRRWKSVESHVWQQPSSSNATTAAAVAVVRHQKLPLIIIIVLLHFVARIVVVLPVFSTLAPSTNTSPELLSRNLDVHPGVRCTVTCTKGVVRERVLLPHRKCLFDVQARVLIHMRSSTTAPMATAAIAAIRS
jgi:hypothetical protein